MMCWNCGEKMNFKRREGDTRRFECEQCDAITTIADGHRRVDFLRYEEKVKP